jgi:hypothetical protein
MYYSTTSSGLGLEGCTAHITRNRNRFKIYEDTIYLKNGETFEIELFNPSTAKVLAEIKINGIKISSGGIILRPGERVYLERFIETNNKFLFETYEIDKSDEAINAIRDNGTVEVEFFGERHDFYNNRSFTIGTYTYGSPNTTGELYSTKIGNSGIPGQSTCFGGTTENFIYSTTTSVAGSKSLETGRIEKGDSSNQDFKQSHGTFNYFPSKSCKYRILPESQKPIESNSIRNYCTDCGTRMKKQTWKFCPNCGCKI